MADQIYMTVYTDSDTLAALDRWAAAEQRSRNNLMQVILSRALQQRQAALKRVVDLDRGASSVVCVSCADADESL